MLTDAGLVVSSLQAILFGAGDVALLGEEDSFAQLLEHLRHVSEVAATLGATRAVLGAPRQRSRGNLSAAHAFELGADRLRACANVCYDQAELVLALEPVPAHYGGDFLTNAHDVLDMVRIVDQPGLRLHLDTGCVKLGGDDISAAIRNGAEFLSHFHAAELDLGDFATPAMDHLAAAEALAKDQYSGFVVIEMRQADDWSHAIFQALSFVRNVYNHCSVRKPDE